MLITSHEYEDFVKEDCTYKIGCEGISEAQSNDKAKFFPGGVASYGAVTEVNK